MNSIISSRLILIPLTLTQLKLIAEDRNLLEREMGLSLSTFELNIDDSFLEEFTEAVKTYLIPKVEEHQGDAAWYTHWLIVHRALNLTIGGMGGTGEPDEKGQVMIGYFVDKKFEGQGYATEALSSYLEWLSRHPDLKTVVADTYEDNIGSQRVLQKNDFFLEGPTEEGVRWRKQFPILP